MSAYSVFKETVLSQANRASSVFTSPTTSIDMVLVAMNNARRQAQRNYTFEIFRQPAYAAVSMAGVSLLTDFDANPTGAGALVVVKQIDGVYEYGTATVGATTVYYRTNRVPFWRHSQFNRELGISPSTFGGTQTILGSLQTADAFVYQQGTNVYHSNLSTPTYYLFDVVAWLPDHDGGAGTDFFLTYGADWLQMQTIKNMNAYLKDTEQVQVSSALLDEAWNSMKQFDAQLAASTWATNLD